jgi:hypothetical protein
MLRSMQPMPGGAVEPEDVAACFVVLVFGKRATWMMIM